MALPEDPNATTARATQEYRSLSYPLTESVQNGVRLRFTKYDRLANTPGSEDTTGVIWMPMPVSIPDVSSIRTTSNFDMERFGMVNYDTMAAVLDAPKRVQDLNVADIAKIGTDNMIENLKLGLTGVKDHALRTAALVQNPLQTQAQAFAGIVQNPHTTLLFEGVNLKSFHLEWRLSARSKDESDAIQDIIDLIKFRSHPEEELEGFALNYPDLVYAEFTGPSAEYLPKYQRAFINNIVATPDSGGGMAFYKGGAPVTINLQISFTELNIVTRDTLERQGRST